MRQSVASSQSGTLDSTNKGLAKSAPQQLLVALGVGSLVCYALITWLSHRFYLSDQIESLHGRPILLVLGLFGASFLIYVFAIRLILNQEPLRHGLRVIIGFAILFRLVVFFSTPIQEVDIYRYLWDGEVCSQGVSPFRFSPTTVINAMEVETGNRDLDFLASHARNNRSLDELLHKIHFRDLPTVYPPTSQAVFALAAMMTPDAASVETRVKVMKCWLIAFDLATLWLVIQLLSICRANPMLSIVYGWCPLLIKEISNSGHLDSIATFLTTLAVFGLVVAVYSPTDKPDSRAWIHQGLLLTSLGLALSVGAKIFPVVLVPLFAWVVQKRKGWIHVVLSASVFIVVLLLLSWPMVIKQQETYDAAGVVVTSAINESEPSEGLAAFVKYWEMNDLLFMVVVENLKPEEQFPSNAGIWFSFAPQSWRKSVANATESWGIPNNEGPFLVTRLLTTILFVILAFYFAARAGQSSSPQRIIEYVFLTLATFWFLSPTQNPWYWTWTLPFLPFVRQRAWFLVSGFAFAYYLRFWIDYHFSQQTLLTLGHRDYVGTEFFDFFVPWIEFGPILLWIWGSAMIKFLKSCGSDQNLRKIDGSEASSERNECSEP